MDDILPIIGIAVFIGTLMFFAGHFNGQAGMLEEMEKYGNVRIDGKMYTINEVISGDK